MNRDCFTSFAMTTDFDSGQAKMTETNAYINVVLRFVPLGFGILLENEEQ